MVIEIGLLMNIEQQKFHKYYTLIIEKIKSTPDQAVKYVPKRRIATERIEKLKNPYSTKLFALKNTQSILMEEGLSYSKYQKLN